MSAIKYKKQDDITIEVIKGEEKKIWTLETLEHAVAQIDFELDHLKKRRQEYTDIQKEADNLGLIHSRDAKPGSEKVGKKKKK